MPIHLTTIQIRLTAETLEQAEAAITELRHQLGTSRVMLQTPRQGRDKRGDGQPPYFVYGSFQFSVDLAEPPASQQRAVTVPTASTGKTERLQPPSRRKRQR